MKPIVVFISAVAFCAVLSVRADIGVVDQGIWPKSWPAELEPLRKQARTLEGPLGPRRNYEIPFTKREEFEAAWPHLLKVKSKGEPVVLVRAPQGTLHKIEAGVIVHSSPAGTDKKANLGEPLGGRRDGQQAWTWTNHIILVVDGEIVDLNRIPLPAETPIIDERFKEAQNK